MPGQEQGSQGFKTGNLRRELDTVAIAVLNTAVAAGEAGTTDVSLQLTGLSAQLKLQIGVFYDSGSNKLVAIPANGATMQITPFNKLKDANKTYGRPVFQDPTKTTNIDAPQPQEVPFSWEGPFTVHTGAMIDVVFNLAAWNGFGKGGNIVVQVIVEYNGQWWDVEAIQYVMSQVQLQQKNPFVLGTL